MKRRVIAADFSPAVRAVRSVLLLGLLPAVVGGGRINDYLRGEQRLIFPGRFSLLRPRHPRD